MEILEIPNSSFNEVIRTFSLSMEITLISLAKCLSPKPADAPYLHNGMDFEVI